MALSFNGWKVKFRGRRGTGIEQFPAVRDEEISLLHIPWARVPESLIRRIAELLRRNSIRDNYRRTNFRHRWTFFMGDERSDDVVRKR